jgi:D-alanyl-lipoteichoic acid acyltransferase DltB (MBOAT superfamily)
MDSASFQFVFFGLAAACVSNFSHSRIWRSTVLMVASVAFLILLARNPIEVLPFVGFLLLGYGGLFLLAHGWSRSLLWSILAVIFVYVWLKKYTFLPEQMFLHSHYFTLGLSYIFFRVLHLLIETGDGSVKKRITFGSYLLYTLNFTTFVSGPIQRYDEFARDQFATEPIPLGPRVIGLQLERIVRGLFKVNVLAMLLNNIQEDAMARLSQSVAPEPKLVAVFQLAVVYPFFLYANFSGYIDIVIAVSRLMRVRLPENFDRPFAASSFLDFWSRWHITLSSWLKTYVYNPLLVSLMRRISSTTLEPFLGVFCFFITFFLVGVWHGRTSEFMIFGVLQGSGVAFNKLWQLSLTRAIGRSKYKELARNPIYIAFGRGLTFSWFAFTLFWFWGSWTQINKVFGVMNGSEEIEAWLAIWMCATAVLAFWEWLRAAVLSITIAEEPVFTSRYARVVYACALGVVAVIITVLLNQPAPEIVYKSF